MSLVLTEHGAPGVVLLTLNRPERRNALTVELLAQLTAEITAAGDDETQRVLILRGAGPAFCAGLDLHEAAEPAKAHASAEHVAAMLLALSHTRLITIAAVHGAAVAGGAGIMSACDFAIAAEGTKIGYPEVRRGLVAGLVLTFLRRQLRERDIRELLFTGELIDAHRAREIGLVNQIVAGSELLPAAEALARKILQGAPGALTSTKRLIEALSHAPVSDHLERALEHHLLARESAEAAEGIAAFVEKRTPRWAADAK